MMRVVAVGGSAGSMQPLIRLIADLPADRGVCVLVTVHLAPARPSILPKILGQAGRLPAAHARDGAPLHPNMITVAPPDRHLVTVAGRTLLSEGPKVHRHRPSVDVMFGTAAQWVGPDLVAVVLSGALHDGAAGAAVVARAGGTVFVQDPAEAAYPAMPNAALAAVPTACGTPIAGLVTRLTRRWSG